MPLFQNTVVRKYAESLDKAQLDEAYKKFSAYFLNSETQANIKNAKEEQFQEGFLRELFGNVLGYTLNPNPNFNLTTELKNTSNSKKADGAILLNDKAVAVIELKGTVLTKKDEFEWIELFEENKQKALTLKAEIAKTDADIDRMVYALYELTEDEIKIVEGVS